MMQQTYIGVDISKARLDVFIPGQGFFSVCNDAAGIAELVARGRPLTAWFIFESCGSYERMLVQALAAAAIPFTRLNLRQARDLPARPVWRQRPIALMPACWRGSVRRSSLPDLAARSKPAAPAKTAGATASAGGDA